jgi:Fe-S cluster assembly protein SufD
MTTATPKAPNVPASYLADYRALQTTAPRDGAGPDWFGPLRQRAWELFSETGLPTARRGNERWKYTNLAALAKTGFVRAEATGANPSLANIKAAAPWDDAWATAVLIDGRLSPALSRNLTGPATVMGLAQAARERRDAIEPHLTRIAGMDEEQFTLLNTAFLSDGVFVHIPDGLALDRPLHIVFASTSGPQPRASHPRALILAGRNSSATVIESHVSLGAGARFSNPVVEVQLEDGAIVEHYRVMAENEASFHIGNTRVVQQANSRLNSVTFETGPAIGRNDVHVRLAAEGAESSLTGLYLTTNSQHIDNNISVTHEKPHGTSHQYFKGILSGKSHAVFSGTVVVQHGAQKTYADQKDMNLLLSHGAEIDTKPSLEILADDVKCFHGATAGHVDLDTLYYMRSRGLDLKTATSMLVRGFASEIVEQVKPEALSAYIESVTTRLLPELIASGD